MRALWITIIATLILFITWGTFIHFAGKDMDYMADNIDRATLSVFKEDWQEGQAFLELVEKRWFKRRLVFSLFFDAVSIGEVEASLFKATSYNSAEEKGSAMAELTNLRHLLSFLFENEKISIENIL
jgi:hypothetical protein